MSNFFEQELGKLFGEGTVIGTPKFVGRACFGTLGEDLRARVQFVTTGIAGHYDAISVSVFNRTGGMVDKLYLRLQDILGVKQVPNNPNFRNGVSPYIWDNSGKAQWYAFQPSAADYVAMRKAVSEYLDVFRDHRNKLIYICAPLRGEVENKIAYAREKAREVLAEGNVPVCPHLLFSPIADPSDPIQDQAAQDMGLRLVEACQQVNVYGPTWTEGMWAEIHHAEKLGIPVMTDQKHLERTPPRPKRGRAR